MYIMWLIKYCKIRRNNFNKRVIWIQRIFYIFNERIILIQRIILTKELFSFNELFIHSKNKLFSLNELFIYLSDELLSFSKLFIYLTIIYVFNGELINFYMFNDSEYFFLVFKIQG